MAGIFNPNIFQPSVFQTTASEFVYPNDQLNLSVLINGVEVADYLDLDFEKPVITSVISQIPTLDMKLFDVPASIQINKWMTIEVLDYISPIFSGVVMLANGKESENMFRINWTLTCSGNEKLTETKLVRAQKFDNQTDAQVLKYYFDTYLPEVDAEIYVSTLRTFTELPFGRYKLKAVLDYLCTVTGGNWYIDYDKYLHYFGTSSEVLPFTFSDSPNFTTSFPYYDFERIDDGNDYYNVIEIIGGNYLSDNETVYLAGNGVSNRISLPLKYHAPTGSTSVQIWRNDGTYAVPSWTLLITKAAYLNSLDWPDDCLYYFDEKLIEQEDAWPNLLNAVKLTGRYEAKLRVRVDNPDAIEADGREIEYPYYDDTIIDKEVARSLATEFLNTQQDNTYTYRFKTQMRKLRAGLLVPIVNSTFAVNESFMAQKVITEIGIGGQVESTVDIGKYYPNLIDLLLKVKKAAQKTETYTSEGVLDWLVKYTEDVTVTEEIDYTPS